MTTRLPILVVLHQQHSTPGRVGQRLLARGHRLDIRRPRYGDPLPPTLAHHAGAVIFGGPMSANDNDPWIGREIDWIGVALREEKPFLGICLGGQMLVRHLGGRVLAHPQGHVEIGYYDLSPTDCGRRLMDWPDKVYQWHSEGMEAPAGSTGLASARTFETQAISVGPKAFGLQFHPELTLAMMYRWTTHGARRFAAPNARQRSQHFSDRFVHDRAVSDWLDRFLDLWLAPGKPAAATASDSETALQNAKRAAAEVPVESAV